MNSLCQTSTLSREGYVALCGTKGAEHQPTAAELRAYEIRGNAMDAQFQPTASALRALEIRGQAMNTRCQTSTLSREGYTALCGSRGAQQQPTAAELRAFEIRGQGIADLSQSSTLSREGYIALFGTKGAEHQPTAAQLRAYEIRGQAMNRFATDTPASVTASPSFNWGDFGIGAGAALGFVLLAGGIAAGLHYGRRSSAPPRTVS